MGDQYVSLHHDPDTLPVQVGVHSVYPLARSEAPNLWYPCLLDSPWWQHLSHASSQVRLQCIETRAVADCYLPNHRKCLLLFQMAQQT